jgi:hypothetical protein
VTDDRNFPHLSELANIMTEWLDDLDGTLLSLRRHIVGGQRSQWVVVKSGDGGDGYVVWEDAWRGAWQLGGAYADPAAVIAAVPALTEAQGRGQPDGGDKSGGVERTRLYNPWFWCGGSTFVWHRCR